MRCQSTLAHQTCRLYAPHIPHILPLTHQIKLAAEIDENIYIHIYIFEIGIVNFSTLQQACYR